MSAKRLENLLQLLDTTALEELEYQLAFRKHEKQMAVFRFFRQQLTTPAANTNPQNLSAFLTKIGISKSYWKLLVQGLIQKTEHYLAAASLNDKEEIKALLLRKIYRKKDVDTLFLNVTQKLKKNVGKQQLHADHLIYTYWLERDYLDFLVIKTPRKLNIDHNLNCIWELDCYYIIQRIKLMLEMILLNRHSPETTYQAIPLYQEITQLIHNQHFKEHVLFQLYKTAFELLTEQSSNYEVLSRLLQQEAQHLSKEDLYYIYTILINFHITQKTSDNSNLERVFELYQEMISYGFLEIQNYIPPGKFKNVVTIACIFKEFKWAGQFIKKHSLHIEPSVREAVMNFNYGMLYFYQGKLDLAQEHLTKVTYVNMFYALDSKSLLARVYYEKGEHFALLRFLASFKDFVRKHAQLSRLKKEGYLNYIKLLKQITNTKQLAMPQRYQEKLLEKLQAQSSVYYKDWLKQKMEEL